jgi:hypothetical protein
MALNSVKVLFKDSEYNYETNVSHQATKMSCEAYFIGKRFNLGRYDNEDFQRCIGIEFTDKNFVSPQTLEN